MPPCNRNHRALLLFILLTLLSVAWPAGAASPPENAWNLPPLVLPDLEQRERKLYDWHGKVIILNFWASWCGPCQIELPHLVEFQNKYGDIGLQVIGIGLDEPAKLANVVRSLQIPYPILHIPPRQGGLKILREWGNSPGVLPYTVVIDRDGSIVFNRAGVFDDEAFDLIARPLLGNIDDSHVVSP